jgi:hypothetical protein
MVYSFCFLIPDAKAAPAAALSSVLRPQNHQAGIIESLKVSAMNFFTSSEW